MKQNLTITKVLVALIGLTFTLSSCSTWHYNNPRVSVDREKTILVDPETNLPTEMASIPKDKSVSYGTKQIRTVQHNKASENKSIKTNVAETDDHKNGMISHTGVTKTKSPMKSFTDMIKKNINKINKVDNVEKSAASGWLRIMIILFVVGFILLLVGIFLSVFIYGGFWWLFYAVGALLILAGVIVLILGLLGVI